MPAEKQQEDRRVTFEHPLPAQMMAIDGTWRRACTLKEVSDVGATLQVETSIEGLTLNEFFLLLSSTGLASLSTRTSKRRRVAGQLHPGKGQGQKILRQGLNPRVSRLPNFPGNSGTFGLCALCNLQFVCSGEKL
jgi:hypothetical protein